MSGRTSIRSVSGLMRTGDNRAKSRIAQIHSEIIDKRIYLGQEDQTMAGPKPNYPLQLLDNQIAELRQLINTRNSSQVKVMRARIIL